LVGEDGTQVGSARTLAIAGNGKINIGDPSFFLNVQPGSMAAGYVEISSDGVRLSGSTVFGDSNGETFSSALPLVYDLQKSVVFSHVASNDLYYTGLAILNPNATDANVTIELYNLDGSLVGRRTDVLPAKQKRARLLTEYFPSIIGKDQCSGYIRVISDQSLASYSLFGTTNGLVLSAIPYQEIR
jgi:hypothetical protein